MRLVEWNDWKMGLEVFKNKKAVMMNNIVALIIFIIVFWASSAAIGRTIDGLLFKTTPSEQMTLEHFNNLVDEINQMIDDESVYSIKENVPMYIASPYSVIAFNGDAGSTPIFYYHYTDECYRSERNAGYPCRRFNLAYFTKPTSCEGYSCLCLVKKIEGNNGDVNTVYEINRCTNFSQNVVFYSWMHHTATWEGYEDTWPFGGVKLFYHYYFYNRNYGIPLTGLDFDFFEIISFTNTSWMIDENFDPTNYYIGGGDELPGYISSYSTLFFGGTPPVDDADMLFEMDGFESGNLYIDKIDFSRLNGGNDKIHLFVNPPLSSYYDGINDIRKRTLTWLIYKDAEEYSRLIANGEGDYKFYYLLDYFRWATNPILFNVEDAVDKIEMLDLNALINVRKSIIARLESCEEIVNVNTKSECFTKFSDNQDEHFPDGLSLSSYLEKNFANQVYNDYKDYYVLVIKELLGDDFDEVNNANPITYSWSNDVGNISPQMMLAIIDKLILKKSPEYAEQLLIDDAKKKEAEGLYLEAYDMYIDFIDNYKIDFYGRKGLKIDYDDAHPYLYFLKPALLLNQTWNNSNSKRVVLSSKQYGNVSVIYLLSKGKINKSYLLVPDKISLVELDSMALEEEILVELEGTSEDSGSDEDETDVEMNDDEYLTAMIKGYVEKLNDTYIGEIILSRNTKIFSKPEKMVKDDLYFVLEFIKQLDNDTFVILNERNPFILREINQEQDLYQDVDGDLDVNPHVDSDDDLDNSPDDELEEANNEETP